jgi:hypothetical protein
MKNSKGPLGLAFGTLLLGLGIGASLTGELRWRDRSLSLASFDSDQVLAIRKLRAELDRAQAKIEALAAMQVATVMNEQSRGRERDAAHESAIASELAVLTLQAPAAPGPADLAAIESSDEDLSARLEELKDELERARQGEVKLSDAEVQAKVSELQGEFNEALEGRDGAGAIKAMMALAEMDERAWPELVELWSKMREQGWLGLNGGQQRLWFNAEVFRWALNSDTLGGADPETAQAFKVQALRFMPWYEPDREKQAESYLQMLKSIDGPQGEPEGAERKLLERGWARNGDLYRGAVERLSQLKDERAAEFLAGLVSNQDTPADIRAVAVTGLGRQSGYEAERLLERALQDPSPAVQRAARLATVRRAPPDTGMMVARLNGKGPLAQAGVGLGGVLTKINGQRVRNERELQLVLARNRGKALNVEVNQNGLVSTVNVKAGQNLGIAGEPVRRR